MYAVLEKGAVKPKLKSALEPWVINRSVNKIDDATNSAFENSNYQTDADLFYALKSGKASALGILYDRYSSIVYSLALRILANAQEAEDLTQEIFLTLWRSNTYNPQRSSLSSFLFMLTRSRAIDRLRSRNTKLKFLQRTKQTITLETDSDALFEEISLQERREFVRQALEKLPHNQRQVLEMAYYEGHSHSEIAQQLNTPLGTVKTWARKGLLTLRQNLQDLMG
jgi:RNA polymerase sigma-70 factor (ECF subfamily)